MHSGRKTSRLVLTALGLTLIPETAHANIPLPSLFGFFAPTWIAWLTLGISLLVVTAVEGVILGRVLRVSFAQAIRLAFVANLITTATGLLVYHHLLFALLCLLLVHPFWRELHGRWSVNSGAAALIAFSPFVIFLGWGILTYRVAISGWAIFGSLGPAFLITTLIEAVVIRRALDVPRTAFACLIANVASYSLLALTLGGIQLRPNETPLYYPDFLVIQVIPDLVSQGEIDEATLPMQEAIRLLRGETQRRGLFLTIEGSRVWEGRQYYAIYEPDFAQILAEHGRMQEAIAMLEGALDMPLTDYSRQLLRDQLEECRQALTATVPPPETLAAIASDQGGPDQ